MLDLDRVSNEDAQVGDEKMIALGRRIAAIAVCLAAMVSGIQHAQAQQDAPGIISVQVGTQEIRLAAPEGFCFLDKHIWTHQPVWEYAQSQTAGDPPIAAVAWCEGLKAGEPFGLTALFAVSGETGISRDEVLRTAETIMSVTNAPLHVDAVRFVDDSIRRFIETAETDIGAYRYNDIYIQVGTNKRRDSLFMLGMTPLRDMVLRSLTLFPITDENNLGAFLWVHGELLSSVRRHTPGLSLDD